VSHDRYDGLVSAMLGDGSTSLTRSFRVSNQKLRTLTGWAPRYPSAREGLIATAGALS
jgi:hypothetical protein